MFIWNPQYKLWSHLFPAQSPFAHETTPFTHTFNAPPLRVQKWHHALQFPRLVQELSALSLISTAACSFSWRLRNSEKLSELEPLSRIITCFSWTFGFKFYHDRPTFGVFQSQPRTKLLRAFHLHLFLLYLFIFFCYCWVWTYEMIIHVLEQWPTPLGFILRSFKKLHTILHSHGNLFAHPDFYSYYLLHQGKLKSIREKITFLNFFHNSGIFYKNYRLLFFIGLCSCGAKWEASR